MNHAPGMVPKKGKDLYTVFPKQGTDTTVTMEFIKSTVNNHDLRPWTDVCGQLMSWTVEASPSQVSHLEGHGSIDRVAKLEFTIYPVNGQNLDQCNATDASFGALLNDKVNGPRVWDDRLRSWTAFLTNAQVEQVEAIDGVKGPSTSPKAPGPLERRGIMYETQQNTAPELVVVSQPRTSRTTLYESCAAAGSYVYHIETGNVATLVFGVGKESFGRGTKAER
ncbi:hypothetical protein CEP52_015739 [Fusarium oligoseptatum]|uniref:Uncharacterized protein n=1 Tax=Fusarium oligoseptatum TaxID=2604345 RepID=A0A428SAG4_9HYPO|nr:hypothetical protein CEP52_015739 [Fusarium oligoseptatum]